VIYNTN